MPIKPLREGHSTVGVIRQKKLSTMSPYNELFSMVGYRGGLPQQISVISTHETHVRSQVLLLHSAKGPQSSLSFCCVSKQNWEDRKRISNLPNTWLYGNRVYYDFNCILCIDWLHFDSAFSTMSSRQNKLFSASPFILIKIQWDRLSQEKMTGPILVARFHTYKGSHNSQSKTLINLTTIWIH